MPRAGVHGASTTRPSAWPSAGKCCSGGPTSWTRRSRRGGRSSSGRPERRFRPHERRIRPLRRLSRHQGGYAIGRRYLGHYHPSGFGCRVRGLFGGPCFLGVRKMASAKRPYRTIVYVDGFNSCYGAVRGTPRKWLDTCDCAVVVFHRRLRSFARLRMPSNETAPT